MVLASLGVVVGRRLKEEEEEVVGEGAEGVDDSFQV